MKNPTPNLDYNAWASWRGISATAMLLCAFMVGCRSPIIEINRNAPLISSPLINANGNTVPLVGQ